MVGRVRAGGVICRKVTLRAISAMSRQLCASGLIVDILDRADPRQFRCGVFRRFAEPRTGRSETAEHSLVIDEADIERAEAHDVMATFELGNAEKFSDEGVADEDVIALPADL